MSKQSNWQVVKPKIKPDEESLVESFKKAFDSNCMMYTEYLDIEKFIEQFKDVLTEEDIKKLKQ